MREWVWVMCNRVLKGEGWPELWKEGVVVPIVKRLGEAWCKAPIILELLLLMKWLNLFFMSN